MGVRPPTGGRLSDGSRANRFPASDTPLPSTLRCFPRNSSFFLNYGNPIPEKLEILTADVRSHLPFLLLFMFFLARKLLNHTFRNRHAPVPLPKPPVFAFGKGPDSLGSGPCVSGYPTTLDSNRLGKNNFVGFEQRPPFPSNALP
jgi:hypothetical protein